MLTAGFIYHFLDLINFHVDIRHVCVFLAPLFSGATAVATYLFTAEVKDSQAGLLAAAFIGIAPGYISRSVAGSYDNEGIAIFLLMITFYMWLKAVKNGSALWGALTALSYFYMVSAWGGYVFIINLIPIHVLALIVMGRFSTRLYCAYCSFYVLGTIASMQVPFVGFQPVKTSEHMAALGIFGLLQLMAFVELLRSHLASAQFQVLLRVETLTRGGVGGVEGRGGGVVWSRDGGGGGVDALWRDRTLDRSFLFSLGHKICSKIYSNHRVCF